MISSPYRTFSIGVSVLLVSASLSLGFLFSDEAIEILDVDQENAERSVHESGLYDQDYYDGAYLAAGDVEHVDASAAIVAHHYLVADKIAEVFASIGSSKTDTVILLGPNHFGVGQSPAQVSMGLWETPQGDLKVDQDLAQDLIDQVEVLAHEELAFEGEHSISLITPFIKESFPNATFVPIMVHDSLSADEAREIAEAITAFADDAVVIASIDMSHILPNHTASFHDEVTMRTIQAGGEGDEVNLEIDANRTLDILLGVNEIRGDQDWTMTHHDSSIGMGVADEPEDNTSHILGFFTEGDPIDDPFLSMQIVGDIMLDRGVRTRIDEADDVNYPWLEVERFLQGTHLRVGNLEGTVNEQESTYTYDPPFRFVFDPTYIEAMAPFIDVVSLANNHSSDVGSAGEIETQEWLEKLDFAWFGGYSVTTPRFDTSINGFDVSLIGYHAFQPNSDELATQIEQADQDGSFVIVLPHWGTEYVNAPGSSQQSLAEFMIEAGADLIVGGHPHVPQGIEIIDDVLVVYSLGNFVFDQQIPETWEALTVGLILDEDEVTIHLLPVGTRSGQPAPLSDSDADELLEFLAGYSDEELQSSVMDGIITLPRL